MKIVFALLFLFVFSSSYAQTDEPKFGDIEIADLKMTRYENDTTAAALILFDYGSSTIELGLDYSFRFVYKRHCRIKIFDQSADHLGNISIVLWGDGNGKDVITSFDAASFNLVDGKIVKKKLEYKDGFKEESRYISFKKYAFSEVREGTILEYSYTITSESVQSIRGWYFQSRYPTLYSQYRFEVPEFYTFRQTAKGYLQFDSYKTESKFKKLSYTVGLESLSFASGITTMVIKNAPAFVPEPNIDCDKNYIQYVEFELSSVEFPGRARRDFVESWESVNRVMFEEPFFGSLLNNDGFIKDTVEMICTGKISEMEKATSIYNYVQNKMVWDNTYRIWSYDGLKKPFANSGGNSSEINLLLTMMLKTAGLKADPVLFSTRDNGYVKTFSPTVQKFNSVLTKINIDGKIIILDATDKYCPFGMLPPNDLNENGIVINSTGGDWVELSPTEKFKETKNYSLKLNDEGVFSGVILGRHDGYAALDFRTKVAKEKNCEEYFRKIQEGTSGLTVNNFTVKDLKNNTKPIIDTLHVELTNLAEISGDKIIFKPLLTEALEKNIYKLDERKYPVDYNYPVSNLFIFDFTIPEGFMVESMPASITMKLPDNSISMSYTIQNSLNTIKLIYKFNIAKTKFLPEEYADLKVFYDQMVRKHSELIILKKIS